MYDIYFIFNVKRKHPLSQKTDLNMGINSVYL